MSIRQKTLGILPFLLAVALVGSGCGSTSTESNSNSDATIASGGTSEIELTVYSTGFEPETVYANQGDTVVLNLFSPDGDNGIALPAYSINEYVNEGDTEAIEFVADATGSYTFYSTEDASLDGTLMIQ